jgi:hypothetical protein
MITRAAEAERVNIHSNASLRGDPSATAMDEEGDRNRHGVRGTGADSLDRHSNTAIGRGGACALSCCAGHGAARPTGAAALVSAHARVIARINRRRTGPCRSGAGVRPAGVSGKHGRAARTHRSAAWAKRRDAGPCTNRTCRRRRRRAAASILLDRDGGSHEVFSQGS